MNDWQLLQNYAECGSESAFRALVDRYLGLVHSAALRQVNNPQLAEDISQAVFILLARKARSLREGVVLSGWLFRTTRFVAARALRAEQRRQRREQEALDMQQLATSDPAWSRVAPALDEGLAQLGDTDRNAVLLRFFEAKNHKEVGAALGIKEEAARKRVDRALAKLRGFLAARGVSLSVAALTTLLTAHAAQAAPAELAGRLTVGAAASATAASATLPSLVRETLTAWRWAKLKLLGSLAVGTATVATVAYLAFPVKPAPPLQSAGASAQEGAANPNPVAGLATGHAADQPTVRRAGDRLLRLHVVAKGSGEPVRKAQLALNAVVGGDWRQRYDLATDDTGSAEVPYAEGTSRLDVGVVSWGWAARYATWIPGRDDAIPADYTLRVEPVTNALGGWLRDGQGRPVANAEVLVSFDGTGDASNRQTPRERFGFQHESVVARSDGRGWWTCAIIPPGEHGGFQLEARHPDFRSTHIIYAAPRRSESDAPAGGEALNLLWAGKTVTTMETGRTLTGRVLDEAGRPIARARVAHHPFAMHPLVADTDSEGRFSFSKLDEDKFDFTVSAPGFAPEYREVQVRAGIAPVEVQLKPGALLRLRLTDERGQPVPGADVGLEEWNEHRHVLKWIGTSGAEGLIEWSSAPGHGELELYAKKSDWCYTRGIRLKADGEEHVIRMRQARVLTGRVTDAASGQPIPEVRAFPGYGDDRDCWERLDTRRSTDGTFTVRFEEMEEPWRVRVEAEGYEPFVSQPLPVDGAGTLDLALCRLDLEQSVRGVVWRPDRQPAVKAEVTLLTLEHDATLDGCRFRRAVGDERVLTTDDEGRFRFQPDPKAHTLVAVSTHGFARVRVRDPRQPLAVLLEPWGRIEGTVDAQVRARPMKHVSLDSRVPYEYDGRLRPVFKPAVPEADGRFAFEFVPPDVPLCLSICAGPGLPYHHRTPVSIAPGQTTNVVIADRGWGVKGRLATVGAQPPSWPKSAYLDNAVKMPPAPRGLSEDQRRLWLVDFADSDAGRRQLVEHVSVTLTVAPDGSFERADGLPPGSYRLRAFVQGSELRCQVTLPELPDGGGLGVYDLGTVVLEKVRRAGNDSAE